MAGPSHQLEQFLESFHAPRTDRRFADDFHLGALAALRGIERQRAEMLLLSRLKGDPSDDRVPAALAIVGTRTSVQPLRDALAQASGLAKIRIAEALSRLDASFDPVDILTDALLRGPVPNRGVAARALAKEPPDAATPPLLDALTDGYFAVRTAALGALLDLYDIRELRDRPYSRLKAIGMRLLSEIPSVVAQAADDMRRVVAQLETGKSPDQIGLTDRPTDSADEIDRVLSSMQSKRSEPPWQHDLDLDALSKLDGDARQFAESALLAELHNGDPRIPRALAAMGSERAPEPLREALDTSSGPARTQTARALELLTHDGAGKKALEEMLDGKDAAAASAALKELGA